MARLNPYLAQPSQVSLLARENPYTRLSAPTVPPPPIEETPADSTNNTDENHAPAPIKKRATRKLSRRTTSQPEKKSQRTSKPLSVSGLTTSSNPGEPTQQSIGVETQVETQEETRNLESLSCSNNNNPQKQEPPPSSPQPLHSPDTMEQVRQKYEAQNRAMAKSYSLLQQRATDLERQLHSERGRNLSLQQDLIHWQTQHQQLESKMSQLEEYLFASFNEISTSVTSIITTGYQGTAIADHGRRNTLSTIIEASESDHDSLPNVSNVSQRRKAKLTIFKDNESPCQPLPVTSNSDLAIEPTVVDEGEKSVLPNDVDEQVVEETTPAPQPATTNAEIQVSGASPKASAELSVSPAHKEPVEDKASAELSASPAPKAETKPKRKKTTKIDQTKARSPLKKKSINIVSPKRKTKKSAAEAKSVSFSPPRRRSRSATPINYALPSLRSKMRRESSALIDAVHEKRSGEEVAAPTNKKSKHN